MKSESGQVLQKGLVGPTRVVALAFGILYASLLLLWEPVSVSMGDAAGLFSTEITWGNLETNFIPFDYSSLAWRDLRLVAPTVLAEFQRFGGADRREWEEVWSKRKARRSRLDLQAAIVRRSASNKVTANYLILRLNLNNRLLKSYLGELLEKGLIEVRREGRFATYSATPKGIDWLNLYWKLVGE